MTNGATGALGGVANFQVIRDARGASQSERGERARVYIEFIEADGLVVLFARATVATRGAARGLALERGGGVRPVRLRVKRRKQQRGGHKNQGCRTGEPPKDAPA